MRSAFALVVALSSLAACYSPKVQDCTIRCGADEQCPDGNSCSNGLCTSGESCESPVPTVFAGLSAGRQFFCSLDDAGAVFCWGRSRGGQAGSMEDLANPRLLESGGTFSQIDCGAEHCCGIRSEGPTACWGSNSHGQLGQEDVLRTASSPESLQIPPGAGDNFAKISAGRTHTCAIHANQNLYCWGDNTYGQLGQPLATSLSVEPLLVELGAPVRDLSAGDEFTCAVTTNGEAFCWGNSDDGRLGDGVPNGGTQPTPQRVDFGSLLRIDTIAVGDGHACAITEERQLWCWGENSSSEAAAFDGAATFIPPTLIGLAQDDVRTWDSVAVGGDHTCALRDNATGLELYCWGKNRDGQVGNGELGGQSGYAQVEGNFVALAAGFTNTCALDADGAIWCWGDNDFGQLAQGSVGAAPSPTQVTGPGVDTWKTVAAGDYHTCAVALGSAQLYCWGANTQDMQGHGPGVSDFLIAAPRRSTLVPDNLSVEDVDVGSQNTCAVVGGDIWCWGDDFYDQTGIGYTSAGQAVNGLPGAGAFVGVTVGGDHACALSNGGIGLVHNCWGKNMTCSAPGDPCPNHGEIVAQSSEGDTVCWSQDDDDGSNNVLCASDENFTQTNYVSGIRTIDVAVGRDHICYVERSERLVCQGQNNRGQLGSEVFSLDRFEQPDTVHYGQVSAGRAHTCAIRMDTGFLDCFGANDRYQVGSGTTDAIEGNPVTLDAESWRLVSAGRAHTCGIRSDDTLWCWGSNTTGQLGIGVPGSPVPLPIQ